MPLLDPLSQVKEALRKGGVVSDVVPESFLPSLLFTVRWGNDEALLGNEVQRDKTLEAPQVQLMPMELMQDDDVSISSFTLQVVMVDPDAPSRKNPETSPFRHWIMTGLEPPTPGEIIAAASAGRELLAPSPDPLSAHSTKNAITAYMPPTPPEGSGPHRYVFLLFREPRLFDVPPNAAERDTNKREKWNVWDFANRFGLELVGANYCIVCG